MLHVFNKNRALVLLTLLALTNSPLMAWECCEPSPCNRAYIGGFGGGIYSNSTTVTQRGTIFFLEADGGPLAVDAQGSTRGTSSGFGGVQIGYEWSNNPCYTACSGWSIAPAIEAEAYWLNYSKRGNLVNPTDRFPAHEFSDSFNAHAGVYLANVVFSLNNSGFCSLTPYVGGGIGATRISINNAASTQTTPAEPGVNHFNSGRSDTSWAFAAQVKAGLRYNVFKSFHIFGEYRYLFVDSSNYIFGSTVSPGYPATSPWNVKLHNTQYNAFVFGIQYDL